MSAVCRGCFGGGWGVLGRVWVGVGRFSGVAGLSVEHVYACPGCEDRVADFEVAGQFQHLSAGVAHDARGGVPEAPSQRFVLRA